jgi:hypothetical protein
MSINASSKGEKKIMEILSKAGIKFIREYSFKDLKGKKEAPLRFDFAFYLNNQLILLDYDGIQHYNFTKHFHKNIFIFNEAKERDRRKNSYCLAHNIPFYRIPYWDLDKINIKNIFNDNYKVKTKFHNDILINGREK